MSLNDVLPRELVIDTLMSSPQGYPPVGGSLDLRTVIARMYGGASPDHVHVTNGATEANFMAAWRLLEGGDELVTVVPGYVQTANIASSWGLTVRPLRLRESLGWQFDLEDLKSVVTQRTKAIQLCNPNNPTGSVLAPEQRSALVDAARDADAWILCDEVYTGSELDNGTTETLWGGYERVLVTNGLCKSYGLPGLRVGWLVGPPETLREIVSYRDYVTITHTMMSDRIAQMVLEKRTRSAVLERNRAVVRKAVGTLAAWVRKSDPVFSYRPPDAGPMCFVRYASSRSSSEVAGRLVKEKSVLVVPGDLMGMDGYLRVGIGLPREYLTGGLDRVDEFLRGT